MEQNTQHVNRRILKYFVVVHMLLQICSETKLNSIFICIKSISYLLSYILLCCHAVRPITDLGVVSQDLLVRTPFRGGVEGAGPGTAATANKEMSLCLAMAW